MIIESILNLLISLIPNFTLGLDITSAIAQIASFIAYANYYIDLNAFFACAGAVLGVWIVCAVPSVIISLL